MKLQIDESAIIWPGNTTVKPQGYMIPTRLKVRPLPGSGGPFLCFVVKSLRNRSLENMKEGEQS